MASRIVKALKNAKSSLKSQDIAVEEPEIVAVIPPPQDPKRSQPPPTPPAAKQKYQNTVSPPPPSVQLQPSPPLSPLVQKKSWGKELKEQKKKDLAVLVELPKSPSAQAYEVAHSQKLQDQYFNPVFEDESRTPRDGAAAPSPEKVAETLKAVVDPAVAS
ncbi:hypothetical protein EV426DRAFT_87414 [Tirmania nivea]|nr:hypothetical protein EV426DRAFT_87414 [Tirmania nivea]